MNNIAICIPTYKRTEMLDNLLSSISACELDESLIKQVNIIVVDNDAERTAESTVLGFDNNGNFKFHLSYFNYREKGLANVRNEMLRRAFDLAPDFVVFIDDDEFVTTNWLNELVKAIINTNADIVRGPVLAVNDPSVPENILCWFGRERYPDGTQLFAMTTGNLIMKRTSLEKYNVWFDVRFNTLGSEDGYFGVEVLKKGAKMCWADNAITYETIPRKRANLKWLAKRIFRTSSTFSYILKLEKKYLLIVKKILVSIVYLILGVLALIALLTNVKKKYWGVLKVAEGFGGLCGLFNIIHEEYKV